MAPDATLQPGRYMYQEGPAQSTFEIVWQESQSQYLFSQALDGQGPRTGVLECFESGRWKASLCSTSSTPSLVLQLEPLCSTPCVLQIDRSDGLCCRAQRLEESEEWKEILAQPVDTGKAMLITAAPGSGKSTLLREWCRGRPNNNILVLAFNRAVSEQMRENFRELGNVTVKTIHAVAHGATRHLHNDRVGEVSGTDLKNFLDCRTWEEVDSQRKRLAEFCASSSDRLLGHPDPRTRERHKLLWEHFGSGRCSFRMPHDVYLKFFQLDKSLGSKAFADYDTIVLDEAQDCTDCMLDAVKSHQAACVMACDPRQNIYQFRHVTGECLRSMQVDHRMILSQSFRFGETIAAFLTKIARKSPPPVDLGFTVRGLPGIESRLRLDSDPHDAILQLLRDGKKAVVLARKNSTLWLEAMKVLADMDDSKAAAFIGGFDEFEKSQLIPVLDLLCLREGRTSDIRSPYVSKFRSLDSFRSLCENKQDMDWLPKFSLLDSLSSKMGSTKFADYLDEVAGKFSAQSHQADVVFATVHQFKGLGFENVVLLEDFLESYTEEEYNIFYVACSRVSTGTLFVSPGTMHLLEARGNRRKRPRSVQDFDDYFDDFFEPMFDEEPYPLSNEDEEESWAPSDGGESAYEDEDQEEEGEEEEDTQEP
eukprot:s453_g2.t1